MSSSNQRLYWVDQARGWSIFLVVYGHNFPVVEPYIYSVHVPLFFFISGMFHKAPLSKVSVIHRAKTLLIPYFSWASMLFLFWLFVGRNFGKSSTLDLSPLDNFLGIFYAQGGQQYMDWGIPLWFLPCIFMVFVFYGWLWRVIPTRYMDSAVLVSGILGMLWAKFVNISLPWSIDVALVALIFYRLGHLLKRPLEGLSIKNTLAIFTLMLGIHLIAFYLNPEKIDMYRSIYGNPLLFLLSGAAGSMAYLLLFKLLPRLSVLSYLGQHSIVILATHLRALTLIKLLLFLALSSTVFVFSEWEKLGLSLIQLALIVPLIWMVNKTFPILDGKAKRN